MYLRQTCYARPPRRGVILLIVIALLTLFAVVGVSFVLYSQAQSDAARIFRDSRQVILTQRPPDAGTTLLGNFLRQFIFDENDLNNTIGSASSEQNVKSGLRGHSLARTMY